ncbi:hypothetical protein HPB50_013718 [Hyalomma asiaticum]|uniref:Uncharacterized protein n=1 Tax=Hyalomma asiaticum TaxID=266040 RepID=A0ACB7SQD3_HYAAI|nr:hypothetical protein HPB50_013718 [Hyalomma asiaticum]
MPQREKHEKCMLDGVDALMKAGSTRTTRSGKDPLGKVGHYFQRNKLCLLVSDKEGGFVVMEQGDYSTRATEAIRKNFDARRPNGGASPEVVELCAVTDKLRKRVDALLAPCTLDKLMQIQRESAEFAVPMVRAEQAMAEVDCECEMSTDEVPVDRPGSTDSREGSRT